MLGCCLLSFLPIPVLSPENILDNKAMNVARFFAFFAVMPLFLAAAHPVFFIETMYSCRDLGSNHIKMTACISNNHSSQ